MSDYNQNQTYHKNTNQAQQIQIDINLNQDNSQINQNDINHVRINQSQIVQKVRSVPVQQKHLKLKLITWNLMGSLPTQSSVNKLINKQNLINIDILVIATQQCERTLLASFFNDCKQGWEHMIFDSLHQLNFVRITSNTLQGLHMIVFTIDRHFKQIKNIENKIYKCGFYGITGNKGANCIQFQIHNQLIILINVHLAAGHDEVQQRNTSLLQIKQQLGPKHNVDTCFIIGDFNYRINTNEQQAIKMNKCNFESLNSYISQDQMLNQKQLKSFFKEYKQGQVNFPPTYKMDLNTNRYSQNRIPGWTDRIFYRKTNHIQLQRYYCEHQIFGSDHRPVIATFNLKIDIEISQQTKKEKQQQRRKSKIRESKQQDDCLLF